MEDEQIKVMNFIDVEFQALLNPTRGRG